MVKPLVSVINVARNTSHIVQELEKRELQKAIEIRRMQSSKTLDKNAIAAHNKSNRSVTKVSPELVAAMERQRLQKNSLSSKYNGSS